MRALIMLAGGMATVVLGNYWLNPYAPVCREPIRYHIGAVDDRFGVTRDEALTALRDAEKVWEESIGRSDIFEYDDNGPFSINFIYDERQRQAEEALKVRQDLAERGDANEVLTELHQRLVNEYETHKGEYESRLVAYERDLAAYNAEVERYNREGGAPEYEYRRLNELRRDLNAERRELDQMFEELGDLAEQINSVGEKGNELVGEYNDMVADFNHTFASGHEYTQGDYRGREINIYTFTDKGELVLVLAHELGHALALPHVDNPESIMYYLLDEQPRPPVLSDEDKTAFRSWCEAGFLDRLILSWRGVYNGMVNN